MKILITGALGHIGSKLIRNLPKVLSNLEIVMLDNLATQRYCSLFNLPSNCKYTFIDTNIKTASWKNVLKNIEVVIHLAALTDAAGTADKPELVFQNNFESTKILIDACHTYAVPVIFPSTTSVYGSQKNLVDEKCLELQPQSPYASCKIEEENYIFEAFKEGLTGVLCRLGTIYGVSPGMRFHTAVNKFCWQAVLGLPITVWETALNQKRPYLHLDDCCNAIVWMLEKKLYNREVYNIVSNNHTVQDVINEIKKYKPNLEIQFTSHKIMNQLSYEVSASKFISTGFNFDGQLANGIADTMQILINLNR